MDISFINSQALLHLLSLTEKKEEILRILEQIDAEILRTLKGGVSVEVVEIASAPTPAAPALKPVAAAKAPAKPAKAEKARRGKSGGLKGRILALLEEAGDQGLRVKKIAEKLNAKPGNISVWFSTTGKDITTKLAPGLYAKKGTGKPAVVKAAKPVKAKKKGGISPEGRAKIAAATKARWAKSPAGSIRVKPLSSTALGSAPLSSNSAATSA